jgi:hypothetical protein
MPCAVVLASLVVAGCSVAEGSSTSPTAQPTMVVPRTQTSLKPAADCTRSTVPLATASDTDGVQLTLSTDPSGTSLLLKNTGSLSVVVIPDANFTSRLVAATYANPQDPASRGALIAVNNSGGEVLGIPPYVPPAQVIHLPPQWALCALTDNLKESAGVRYLQDRVSSAEYFVTKALADQLLLTVSSERTRPVLVRCAKSTVTVFKQHPRLSDIESYAEILSPRATCRAGYQALLQDNARAIEQLEAAVIGRLGGAPHLLANSGLFTLTSRP